ncbi:hypothetical protein MNBD_GAMMA23-1492 [hydrothermal vent metagenome]|uniref:ADP-heptose--lipooligosaccharide heptosyltransferase II n=1 Tax=hydrothermal vent metagenome TaxID=652676 RepID=A0A3B1A021_9ZZZZ
MIERIKTQDKILVVRVGRVGDVVMITAALTAILKSFEQAEIHILTSDDGLRVLNNFNKRVTQFYLYNRKLINTGWIKYKLKRVIGLENYTHIFCFETKPSYLKLFSKSQAKIHVNKDGALDKNYAWHCLQTVNQVTGQQMNEWISLKVNEKAVKQSGDIFIENKIDKNVFIIGLHPSFSGLKKFNFRSQKSLHERGWPEENWAELAYTLSEYAKQKGIKVHIIMDLLEEDRALGERIVALSHNVVTLLIPTMNFERYKATLKSMDLLITPNTGPMHVAGALGTKMVALFSVKSPDNSGPYIAAEQYTPLQAEDMPNPDAGLAAITVEYVLDACKNFIHKEKNTVEL